MLLGADHKPVPPSDILLRLQQVDERLGLHWVGAPANNWAITMRWSQGDPRWKMVQTTQMREEDAWDIEAWLPADCPADQAFGYLERAFRRVANVREDARYLLERMAKLNAKTEEDNMKPVYDLADELIETNAKTLFRDIGKHIPTTKRAKAKTNRDKKKLEEYLRDS